MFREFKLFAVFFNILISVETSKFHCQWSSYLINIANNFPFFFLFWRRNHQEMETPTSDNSSAQTKIFRDPLAIPHPATVKNNVSQMHNFHVYKSESPNSTGARGSRVYFFP